ncbi:probable E3 ubiquitin-protein ligase MID2 isoform X1 [Pimephales promelas]|uniref:probable E3 ubiquitin-protein ligase MID2 isoform X1 n=1 Tax=Pimephales promelas TaxID=90988 RepID=UPI0019559AEA|nr:probable E3 ubiquitin-protein ligase MID2 isoform X1 [Pimephales promelas]XP_039528033.1 probable E3 ubiquitin-protein ligase MID2 isoform X1 [Pimephales promelas]KAG1950910.1 E3 ubiquitin-protein ligase TRIM39-like [Pimephales promelas]
MDDPKTSGEGPLFCPECQILLPSNLKLEINSDLQRKVQDVIARASSLEGSSHKSPSVIMCDQCIGKTEVAVKSCLSCDASLCSAHTLLHQQREALRGHSLIEVTEDLISFKCKEHGEELKLFCQEDQTTVCCLCIAVGSHKNHQAVTLQEACSEFKKVLETNKSLLLQRKHLAESAMQDLKPLFSEVSKNAEAYRLRIVEKYNQIKAQIEEDQKLMLAILETEEFYYNKWLRWKNESLECHVKDINAALRSAQSLLEEENDIIFLQHLKKHRLGSQVDLPLVSVMEQEYSTTDKMKTVEQLVDNLNEVVLQNTQRLWSSLRAVNLDPETAHPELEVSADKLEVHWSKKPTAERKQKTNIGSQYSVQVKERFSSGSHYWEVAVWKKPYWLIGLSYGSATRGQDSEHRNSDFNGLFCYIYHGNGKYLVCQDSNEKFLAVRKTIQKLGIWVDISKGAVSFYDGDTLTLLHSFRVEFSGPVRPIFNPCIDINGQNSQPLSIVHLRNKNNS